MEKSHKEQKIVVIPSCLLIFISKMANMFTHFEIFLLLAEYFSAKFIRVHV